MNRVTYSSSKIFSNISISAKRSNFTLVFLKLLAMLIHELKEMLQDQAHPFQDTYLENSQICLLKIMYHFKNTNHDILLNFLFQNIQKLFLSMRNLQQ